MRRKLFSLFVFFAFSTATAFAHCEIPCGIYGDSLRVQLIKEHIGTVERSIHMIDKLSQEPSPDYNNLVRWVINKDEHCKEIQDIATQYFMFQRVKISQKPAEEKRSGELLALLHRLCVYAMKAKQSTSQDNIDMLRKTIEEFSALYFKKAD